MLYKNLFAWLFLLGVLSSCALRNTSTGLTQYQQAMLCYESKDYSEALRLFEEAMPLLRGKKEEASAYFHRAYCNFYRKKYVQSASLFRYFYETFPKSGHSEEAMYMRGHALYLESPDIKCDQVSTEEAAHVLRNYLKFYPRGAYVHEANIQLDKLNNKLALKAFNNAKLYYKLAYHRAAVVTLETFQEDFPSSSYNEEAAYLKVDAQYCYCTEIRKTHKRVERRSVSDDNGVPQTHRQLNRLQGAKKKRIGTFGEGVEAPEMTEKKQFNIAIRYCQEFMDSYPDSHYAFAVGKIYESLLSFDKP